MRAVILGLMGSILLTGVSSASDFEGIILLNETSGGTTMQQQWFLKGDTLRFEEAGPDAGRAAMIFDAKKKVMYSIQHEEKIYMEISTDETSKATPDAPDDIVVAKTGKSDKAAGYSCEIYHTRDKSDGSTGELCIAKGIGNTAMFGMMSAQAGGSSLLPGWMREMFKDGGFPIKGVDRDAKGQEEARWEAVKIEKKRLDDKLFLPPADYKKHDMAVIRQQFGNAMRQEQSVEKKERGLPPGLSGRGR
ncbi:MAG: DUF4412 domain-containing protein [Nitrospira sp.]|nr:DUF4412 domain-containing protein [Nitrospira sp.]